jgi:hypothetical protein
VESRFKVANCDLKAVGDQHIDAGACAVLECLQDSLAPAVVTQIVLVIGRIRVSGSAYPYTDIAGRVRPNPVTGSTEVIALEQPVAACGKLRPELMEPRRIARSAQVPVDKYLAPERRFCRPTNS